MSKCSNYIPNVTMTVEVVYPRTGIIVASTENFAVNNDIEVTVDNDVYHQDLPHRKRSRNELLSNIHFVISNDAFKRPADTNRKLIGILQGILKSLEPDMKFDMDLIDYITSTLYDISYHCYDIGIGAYYATHQRKRVIDLFKFHNESENIYLSVYYSYSQEDK